MTFIRTGLLTGCAALGLALGCADDVPPTAPVLRNMSVALTPSEETPAVTASSSGTANLIISDTNEVSVQLIVANIDSVTAAHIHAGSPGVAGPIMVNLTPTYALVRGQRVARHLPDSATTLNGVLSHVNVTRGVTAFSAPFTFDSLLTRINNGTAYVNVHTRVNPSGEIRGQIITP